VCQNQRVGNIRINGDLIYRDNNDYDCIWNFLVTFFGRLYIIGMRASTFRNVIILFFNILGLLYVLLYTLTKYNDSQI